MRTYVSIALCALFVPTLAHALTVDEAISAALSRSQGNVRERQTREQAKAASDNALSARSRMLFSLHVSEQFQFYNCPFAVSFATYTADCADAVGASGGAAPLVLRNQNTNNVVLSAHQPLLGLLRISHDYLAQKRNADSLSEAVNATDAKLVEGIRNGFLRYFGAVAAEGVATSSENELTEQVRVAQAREKIGVIKVSDRLRVQVARANAHQQRVVAHAQAEKARVQLLDAIGLSLEDDSIVLEEPAQLLAEAAQPMPERATAIRDALDRRPEIRQAKLALDSAVAAHRARSFSLLPDVDFETAYVRNDGQILAQKDSWYAGIKAQWSVWEWGAGYFSQRAAKHSANAAALAFDDQRRQVMVEVRNAFSDLEAATAAVDAARQAIDSADEAYRVTAKSLEAGLATTTDLLSAQAELATARLNLTRSRYEQAMSRVTLRRLTGD